jgi:ArsR family transcriptional regulator
LVGVSQADELQKVFKTLSDPTRLRILRLIEAEELMVQELMDVLGMAQSRVSRHLAILREAGLLHDRRDGTYVFYRFGAPEEGPWREAWDLVKRNLARDPTAQRDDAALARALELRGERSRSFFDAVGPEWDALRKVFDDDVLRARAITRLVEPARTVADIGTGTGVLAIELAQLGLSVIGVDGSRRMLDAARAKIDAEGIDNIELREGDASSLPIGNGEVDAALAHIVLQYLPTPADAVREMARITRLGGRVVIVDFVRHHQEWMRHELGVLWQGFVPEEVEAWLTGAGLFDARVDVHEARGRGRDLPATFIASARR